ncbi:anti-sigma factor family protein [Qaidamihabitans albus]|uniref:anti-sigma factor family protein n=1 Tax=Qaidamihabitans albus TaxID=2795733 RepID=UPI0018F13FA1|nr:zf-HC2 domain-containing protein [Qaidamihabitans albus]
MTTGHDTRSLGAYVLGALDRQEVPAVERHLASCPRCRAELDELCATRALLGEVPPEALLEGPPDGGELLLRRALRTVRAGRAGRGGRSRRVGAGVAAAVVAAVLAGGGAVLGYSVAPGVLAQQETPAGRAGSATDPGTGAAMTVSVRPAAGWVRLHASVAGIEAGQRCRLVVVAADGTRTDAGSWLVSGDGAQEGTELDGAAVVAPADVVAVEVRNFAGRRLVAVPLA